MSTSDPALHQPGAPAAWGPGTTLGGRYRLITPMGRGAMGEVWQAEHLALGTMLAVKLLNSAHAVHTPELRARFEQEARAAAHIDSRHAVRITDYGVEGSAAYIAMELLHGEDLGDRLRREGRLPPGRVSAIVQEMLMALGKAHAMGIVHRDIKPDNVFLASIDGVEVCKVFDFGIAKLTARPDNANMTQDGLLVGTPAYMSPEQTEGNIPLDGRSDLWSVAVSAFEMMCGQRPFQAQGLAELFTEICYRPVPKPSDTYPVPDGFDAWFLRATQRDPNARFQSAEEMAHALASIIPAEAAAARPVEAPSPAALAAMASSPRVAETTTRGVVSEDALVATRTQMRFRLGLIGGIAAGFAATATVTMLVMLTPGADESQASGASSSVAPTAEAASSATSKPTGEPSVAPEPDEDDPRAGSSADAASSAEVPPAPSPTQTAPKQPPRQPRHPPRPEDVLGI